MRALDGLLLALLLACCSPPGRDVPPLDGRCPAGTVMEWRATGDVRVPRCVWRRP